MFTATPAVAELQYEIEAHSIRLQGADSTHEEIIRLLDCKQLSDADPVLAAVNARGVFDLDETREFRFPTVLDKDGSVMEWGDKTLGRSLSGVLTKHAEDFELQLDYSEVSKKGDTIFEFDSGLIASQPVFSVCECMPTSVLVKADRWYLLNLVGAQEKPRHYLAVRIRKAARSQQGSGQNRD